MRQPLVESRQLETPDFLFFRHTLGEQRTHFLACMYEHEVAFILHYEAATKSIPSQLALLCIHPRCALVALAALKL